MNGSSSAGGYAGFSKRLAAILVDGIIINLTAIALVVLPGAVLALLGKGADIVMPLMSALASVCYVIYFSAMESSRRQATIGKLLLGIRVENNKRQRLSLSRAIVRTIGKGVPVFVLALFTGAIPHLAVFLEGAGVLLLIPILFGVFWYLPMWFHPERQTVHDMICGAVVVDAGPE